MRLRLRLRRGPGLTHWNSHCRLRHVVRCTPYHVSRCIHHSVRSTVQRALDSPVLCTLYSVQYPALCACPHFLALSREKPFTLGTSSFATSHSHLVATYSLPSDPRLPSHFPLPIRLWLSSLSILIVIPLAHSISF